jgi:aspartate/methionine/tyrosine aminotransferase
VTASSTRAPAQGGQRAPGDLAAGYPMRRWVFEDAAGRYDIDLGDSNVECRTLSQLTLPAGLELNYGHDRGSPQLRDLVAQLYGGSPDSVAITHGAQEALYLVYQVLLRPGDQVVTFRPGWQQSWGVPELLSCRVDALQLGPDFALDPDAVAAVAGPDLRLVVVNTPCNPTGRRVPPADIDRLVGLLAGTGAYLLLDEEYELDLAGSAALRHDRVISVSSVSKVYGLPGLRVGWLYGAPELVGQCAVRKHYTSISNSVLCEALAAGVLAERERYFAEYHRLTGTGLALVREWAAGHPTRLRLVPPQGTPFAWLHLSTGEPSLSFCRRALDAGVLLMPAETVGGTGGIRLCFAREPGLLAQGLRRLDAVLATSGHASSPEVASG